MNPVATLDTTDLVQLSSDYAAAWESRDVDRIVAFHAPDGVFHLHAASEPVSGSEAIRAVFAGLIAQIPDVRFEERETRHGACFWVCESVMSGTLAQPLPLPVGGEVAEAGSTFAIDAVDVITAEHGKVTAKHTYLDDFAFLAQLGIGS